MRIISGKYKGRRFDDKIPPGTRPTQDAVRETIFNILNNNIDLEGTAVMDICAGTGALGWEALSRGAEYCCFIDKSKAAVSVMESIAARLAVDDSDYDIIRDDALRYLKSYSGGKFDLIMTDPPYAERFINEMIEIISEKEIIAPGGLLVIEQARESAINIPEGWQELTMRRFGAAKVTFLLAPGETDIGETEL